MNVGSMRRWIGGLLGFGLICTACGGTASKGPDTTTCTPGTKRCDGNQIKRCDDDGAGESVWQSCASAACQVQNGVVSCTPTPCAAGMGVCDGTVATTCSQDGSAPLPGGIDCSASGQACVDGECRDTACTAGAKSCKNGDVYVCAMDGRTLSLSQACQAGEVCSDELGTCLARICQPDQGICLDDAAVTCNSLGTAWLPKKTVCSSQGKVCVDGSCRTPGCAPSALFCQDNDVYRCDEKGAFGSLATVCDATAEHCVESGANTYAYCAKNDCIAGQMVCDGNTIKLCNADNTFPSEGTACKDDELCVAGKCKPRGCATLNVPFCRDNGIYNCAAAGPSLTTQCDPNTECQVIADPMVTFGNEVNFDLVSCVPLACTAGQIGCIQNKIGSCNSQGTSLSGETIDCLASNQVCTTDMTCAASVTDVLGKDDADTELSGNRYVGNVISVQSTRKLTAFQIWMRLSSAQDLRWIVFEQVDNQLISKAEVTAPAVSGSGFVSSGALDYQLEAGKRYALGVVVPADGVVHATAQAAASFGQLIGMATGDPLLGTTLNLVASFSSESGVQMKVTTETP